MRGTFTIALMAAAAFLPGAVLAAEPAKKQVCAKPDPQRQATPAQQRLRAQQCRAVRVPPVVDPTPIFIL